MRFLMDGKPYKVIVNAMFFTSGGLVAVIAVDRLFMVYFPLKSKVKATPQLALIISILTFIIPLVYTSHFLYGMAGTKQWIKNPRSHLESETSVMDEYVSDEYERFFRGVDTMIIHPGFALLFCGIIFIANIAIIIKLSRASASRESNLGAKKDGNDSSATKTTIMLVVMAIVTSCLRLPAAIIHIFLNVTVLSGKPLTYEFIIIGTIVSATGYSLAYLNSCINFFIYMAMSTKFRMEFRRIILFRKTKKHRQSSSNTSIKTRNSSLAIKF